MACEIFSAVMVLNWSLGSSLSGKRFAGFVLEGGVVKSNKRSWVHLS